MRKMLPDIFLLACSELRVEPSLFSVIEDSQARLGGAQAAGTMTVYCGTVGANDAAPERHLGSIQNFEELLSILGIA